MNPRNVAFVIGVVVGLTTAAQGAIPGAAKGPLKVHAKSVTLTGCVAQGIDGDHYVLANAVRREQPPSSTARAGTSGKVGSDKDGASDRTAPYDLQGGEFKAHLGHTVEVTGTSGITGKTTHAAASKSAPERKPLPTFNVESVKMLSATCL